MCAQQRQVHVSYMAGSEMRTDTLYVNDFDPEHILIGTTVLFGSGRNQVAGNHGYWLQSVSLTPCTGGVILDSVSGLLVEEIGDWRPDKIVGIHGTDSTLTVDATVYSTCGHDFLCEVELLLEDSIINLISTGYGSSSICGCCFGLRYEVDIIKEMVQVPMHYVMINNDRHSLRKIPF